MIIIEIATAMIVTQTGTVTGALPGIETGIGEIAIAAIGTVTDSGIKTATFGIPVRSFEVKYQT
jgi:hypothetical protein